MPYYAGLDLHRSMSVLCLKDAEGHLVRRGRVANDPVALGQFFAGCDGEPVFVALEATTNYAWMYDTLERLGCRVELAHPLKVRAIASARIKTDRIDAEVLCDLRRANLLPTSYVPLPPIRDLRELLRHRMRLVHDRTRVKNRLTTVLAKVNLTCPGTDPFGRKGQDYLATVPLPAVFSGQRDDGLAHLEFLNSQITRIDRQLRLIAKEYPQADRLRTIPGIGIFSALLILAEIGEISRFPTAKQLVSYSGLAPGVYQSANTRHGRGITRQGSRHLRWILVQNALHAMRSPGPLRQCYLRLAQGKGHGKAITAVARKLLVGIYKVLHDGKPFCPSEIRENTQRSPLQVPGPSR